MRLAICTISTLVVDVVCRARPFACNHSRACHHWRRLASSASLLSSLYNSKYPVSSTPQRETNPGGTNPAFSQPYKQSTSNFISSHMTLCGAR